VSDHTPTLLRDQGDVSICGLAQGVDEIRLRIGREGLGVDAVDGRGVVGPFAADGDQS
jgi:hypothetical protein